MEKNREVSPCNEKRNQSPWALFLKSFVSFAAYIHTRIYEGCSESKKRFAIQRYLMM
jgi:hypothetical protein